MSIRWVSNELNPNLRDLAPKLHAAIFALMSYNADRAEAYMRANAPWSDRTGNARAGLSAQAFAAPTEHTIVLYHTMPYGVWLEVRWQGRYAIILPTVDRFGADVMSQVQRLLAEL